MKTGLSRYQRSLLARLLCGILPLELEVGRYTGVDKHLRYCRVCETGAVEDEIHFLFHCSELKTGCEDLLNIVQDPELKLDDHERLWRFLCADNLKQFAHELEILYNARQRLIYVWGLCHWWRTILVIWGDIRRWSQEYWESPNCSSRHDTWVTLKSDIHYISLSLLLIPVLLNNYYHSINSNPMYHINHCHLVIQMIRFYHCYDQQ